MVSTNGNGHKNGEKPSAIAPVNGHDATLWDGLAPGITQELDTPIDAALVSQRKGRGGKTFSYIEGHTVIDEANRVFGYGGWGYDVMGDIVLREIDNVDAKTGEIRRIRAYAATVRVTVLGAPPRMDVGFHPVVEDNADGHETAIKGAVTDGLKRAFRSFGARFGNALYGDPQTGIVEVTKQPPVEPDGEMQKLRARLLELGEKQGFDAEQVEAAVKARSGRTVDQLTHEELSELVAAAARKLNESMQQEPPSAA
ncbi:MAG: hypothetical protein F4X20_04770 [Dehalococcoidia bacterium]|nr:hypothetical protein [Dehalococcoidia bacterium]